MYLPTDPIAPTPSIDHSPDPPPGRSPSAARGAGPRAPSAETRDAFEVSPEARAAHLHEVLSRELRDQVDAALGVPRVPDEASATEELEDNAALALRELRSRLAAIVQTRGDAVGPEELERLRARAIEGLRRGAYSARAALAGEGLLDDHAAAEIERVLSRATDGVHRFVDAQRQHLAHGGAEPPDADAADPTTD